MEYKNLVRDFAFRTLKNLELIERAKLRQPDAEVYEVTQLINSMLGLLVFPQQMNPDKIPRIPLHELKTKGWPVPIMTGTTPQVSDLRDLIRCLRNGISHFNLKFLSDGHVLTGIQIWNCKWDAKKCEPASDKNGGMIRTWQAELGIDELKVIVRKFVDLLLDVKA